MRIAVNSRLLVPDKMDGIGRFTYETLKRLAHSYPEVQFDLIFDRKIVGGFDFPKNVKSFHLSPPARHPFLWIIWFEYRLKNFINKGNYDLFLSPEGWIPPGLKCKSLAVIHDLNFAHQPEHIIFSHRKYLQHYFPKFANRANRIATVSEFSKQDIHQTYKTPLAQIDVVYNGANHVFKPFNEEAKQEIRSQYCNGSPFFIFIGTLHPRKNLTHLFKAFEQFKKQTGKPHQLLGVGNRKWWPKELEDLYQSLEYKKEILFAGRKSDDELAKILAASEALTYLPYFEGFGIPILEAFQAEVPVICSNATSMPEVAQDAALLCSPKDIDCIANSMEKVSSDQKLKKELIEKGKIRAKDFSWDRTSKLLWESIEKTLA
jgi:glycosyltransferase involved in cell wall biosynthesis